MRCPPTRGFFSRPELCCFFFPPAFPLRFRPFACLESDSALRSRHEAAAGRAGPEAVPLCRQLCRSAVQPALRVESLYPRADALVCERAGALSFLKKGRRGGCTRWACLSGPFRDALRVASSKKKKYRRSLQDRFRIPHCRSRKWLPSQQRPVDARSRQQRPVIRSAVL